MKQREAVVVTAWMAAIVLGCGSTAAGGSNSPANDVTAGTDTGSLTDADGDDTAGTDSPGDATAGTDSAAGTDITAGTDAAPGTDVQAGDSGGSLCPPVLSSAKGLLHGQPCTDDGTCAYGHCEKGGFLTGYDATKGYCTKDCACASPTAQCSTDNGGGVEYLCAFELSVSGGNPKASTPPQKRCARRCLTDTECAKANPALPHCISSSQYVSSAGVCGFDPSK